MSIILAGGREWAVVLVMNKTNNKEINETDKQLSKQVKVFQVVLM
jgi:hypothetical protein